MKNCGKTLVFLFCLKKLLEFNLRMSDFCKKHTALH